MSGAEFGGGVSDHLSLATPDPDRAALRHDMACAVRQWQLDGGEITQAPVGATASSHGIGPGPDGKVAVKRSPGPGDGRLAKRIADEAARRAGRATVLGRNGRDRVAVGWRRAAFKAMALAGLPAGAVAAGLRIEQSRAYGGLYDARGDVRPEVRERAEALLEWAKG